ncbi:unnamed protein product, partial [Protopolystoma xenopodis]
MTHFGLNGSASAGHCSSERGLLLSCIHGLRLGWTGRKRSKRKRAIEMPVARSKVEGDSAKKRGCDSLAPALIQLGQFMLITPDTVCTIVVSSGRSGRQEGGMPREVVGPIRLVGWSTLSGPQKSPLAMIQKGWEAIRNWRLCASAGTVLLVCRLIRPRYLPVDRLLYHTASKTSVKAEAIRSVGSTLMHRKTLRGTEQFGCRGGQLLFLSSPLVRVPPKPLSYRQ